MPGPRAKYNVARKHKQKVESQDKTVTFDITYHSDMRAKHPERAIERRLGQGRSSPMQLSRATQYVSNIILPERC